MPGLMLVLVYFGLAALAAFIIMQPNRFTITRSAVIDAPPSAVFQQINNLRNWDGWSPWARLDPNATTSFDGPAAGPGAAFEWSGNKEIGVGRMSIVESVPDQSVILRLDMQKPFAASNDVVFTLTPEVAETADAPDAGGWGWVLNIFGIGPKPAQKTRVEWSMTGDSGLVGKVMNLLMNPDKMVGRRFEEGLANLAAVLAK